MLAEAVPARDGERVLDLCTGSGIQALQVAPRSAGVTAVDIGVRAVAMARCNAALNGIVGVTGADGRSVRAGARRAVRPGDRQPALRTRAATRTRLPLRRAARRSRPAPGCRWPRVPPASRRAGHRYLPPGAASRRDAAGCGRAMAPWLSRPRAARRSRAGHADRPRRGAVTLSPSSRAWPHMGARYGSGLPYLHRHRIGEVVAAVAGCRAWPPAQPRGARRHPAVAPDPPVATAGDHGRELVRGRLKRCSVRRNPV